MSTRVERLFLMIIALALLGEWASRRLRGNR